jgi:hypothetical protein
MHCEHSVQEQIRPLLELTVWAAEQRRTAQILTLSGAAAKGAPRWDRRTLDATVFEKIQQEFQAHGRVAVRVPLNVQERSRDSQATFFDLFLERCESSQHKRPVFIRDSLIISDVRCRLMRDICAIVSAEDQVLCQFLGDAENPAHTEWLEESSHFKGRYVHGAATLRFVRNAAADLGQMLQEVPEPEDVELLLDVFSIGTRLEGMPVEFQSRTSRGGLSGSNFRVSRGLSQRDASRGSARSKPWRVTRRKGGFRLAGQLETGSRMEGSIEVAVAYDRRSGNPLRNFSAADFRLDLPPIQIESEGADVQLAGANRLFVYAEATEFSVTVTGFDVNRDLFLQTVFRPANPSGELIN